MRGAFITIEGIEGVGKSTNLALIEKLVSDAGYRAVLTREPGGTELGEKIRKWILDSEQGSVSATTEALLMFAARAEHISEVIEPALQDGKFVICDRFTDATYAYQGGGRGLDKSFIDMLASHVQGPLVPDCTILLDAPPAVGFDRIRNRPLDHFETEGMEFFERVRNTYLDIARDDPDRVVTIDSTAAPEKVAELLTDAFRTWLEKFQLQGSVRR